MKKYEFTGETKTIGNVVLKRIRALKEFGEVSAGDIGGWIEKESNLSQDGDAWVSGNAWVYGGRWKTSPCFIRGSKWSVNVSSPDTVRCGCQDHTWREWHDKYLEISREHDARDVLEEYIRYFNLLCDMYGHEDCKILDYSRGRGENGGNDGTTD